MTVPHPTSNHEPLVRLQTAIKMLLSVRNELTNKTQKWTCRNSACKNTQQSTVGMHYFSPDSQLQAFRPR